MSKKRGTRLQRYFIYALENRSPFARLRMQNPVRIQHVFPSCSSIELFISLRGVVELDDRNIHGFRNLNLIVQDRFH